MLNAWGKLAKRIIALLFSTRYTFHYFLIVLCNFLLSPSIIVRIRLGRFIPLSRWGIEAAEKHWLTQVSRAVVTPQCRDAAEIPRPAALLTEWKCVPHKCLGHPVAYFGPKLVHRTCEGQ